MISTVLLAATLLAAPAAASSDDDAPGTAGWKLGRVDLGAYAGAFDGLGVRRDSGGAALLEGGVTPKFRSGDWTVEVPVRLKHQQTFGASLDSTYGSAYLTANRRVAKGVRLGGTVGFSGNYRPDWPDLYQPIPPDGARVGSTDRYSYFAWHLRLHLTATPLPHNVLRLKYKYAHYGYTRDPNYDPTLSRVHLAPRDNGQHQLEASWRVHRDGYSVAAQLDVGRRNDEVLLARTAGTGGVSSRHPYQTLNTVEPSVDLNLKRLGDRFDVSLTYGYQVQDDTYQGYYSYSGHHPRIVVDYAVTSRLSTRVKGELWWREYGASSKNPALTEDGKRLYDHKTDVEVSAGYALTGTVTARITGQWVRRLTNYPDYVPDFPAGNPNAYPAGKLYDIQWSYVNTQVLAGIEVKL